MNAGYSGKLEKTVVALVILGCGILFAGMSYGFSLHPSWAYSVLRMLIVVLFTLLPACMYYVFIASRKSSLFQEYAHNLYRLGLLNYNEKKYESFFERSYVLNSRVHSYIERFEAVYGPVKKSLSTELLNAIDPKRRDTQHEPDTQFDSGPIISFSTAVPVLLATTLFGVYWLLVLPPWVSTELNTEFNKETVFKVHDHSALPPLLAFLGAYFYSINMLFRRYVRNDLRASAYVSVSLRVVMAVIGAWVLTALFSTTQIPIDPNSPWLLVFSFVIGAFPLVLWRLLREAGSKIPGIVTSIPSMDSKLPISELDGLTVWHQTRLEEEDIENVYNMANADIVDLLVHTKFPPERIIDWVDQAILYTVLSEDDLPNFRATKQAFTKLGIRNASTFHAAMSEQKKGSGTGLNSLVAGIDDKLLETFLLAIQNFSSYKLVKTWREQGQLANRDKNIVRTNPKTETEAETEEVTS